MNTFEKRKRITTKSIRRTETSYYYEKKNAHQYLCTLRLNYYFALALTINRGWDCNENINRNFFSEMDFLIWFHFGWFVKKRKKKTLKIGVHLKKMRVPLKRLVFTEKREQSIKRLFRKCNLPLMTTRQSSKCNQQFF